MDELIVQNKYNNYMDTIKFDIKNPTIRSPYAVTDLMFYQTRETLQDIDTFRNFIKKT